MNQYHEHQRPAQAGGFRLMRYYMRTTLLAFTAVAAALFFLQSKEEQFFDQVQQEQVAFFRQAQDELARQNETAARSSLLLVNESNHVNLTRMVANMLWATDLGPFLRSVERVPINACQTLPAEQLAERRACWAEVGRQIVGLPAFKALDAKAYGLMQSTSVFKIKVWDLRGVTVYSSEHRQVGEYAGENAGWRAAAQGRPASELTHRDRFSAFERVVENRDLISTYVPMRAGGSDQVLGVVELYSDVTPFLGQIRAASRTFAQISAGDQALIESTSRANKNKVERNSYQFLLIVGGLILLLYVILLAIVRRGQRTIDRQALVQAEAAQREQRWHREKMAALATMAANVAHEVGNPLAVIQGVASDLAEKEAARQIHEQSDRIARMMRQIADFAAARGESSEWVDLNAMLRPLCAFLVFDRRFRGTPIEFFPGTNVPAVEIVPDHLNEVAMNLLQACVEDEPRRFQRLVVETCTAEHGVKIRVGVASALPGAPSLEDWLAQSRLDPIRRRVAEMGARLDVVADAIEITVPISPPAQGS